MALQAIFRIGKLSHCSLSFALPAAQLLSLGGSQRSAAMAVGGTIPDYDPTDVPHPSTRAPQGDHLA